MNAYWFRAMGTDVGLLGPGDVHTIEREGKRVQAEFARLEKILSRFDASSDLSRLNACSGRTVTVPPELATVLRLALTAARRTNGIFDPTVLNALEDAGYDRDFARIRPKAARVAPRPAGRWEGVKVEGNEASVPVGVGVDLGGIAKGWAVDEAIAVVEGLPWFVIDAGGDLRLEGDPGGPLSIAIEDPFGEGRDLGRIELSGGAIATSSVVKRAWGPGLHHLIDPRTSLPAETPVVQATALAPTCAAAEVAAKRLLLEGVELLSTMPGIVVMEGGRVLESIGSPRENAA